MRQISQLNDTDHLVTVIRSEDIGQPKTILQN